MIPLDPDKLYNIAGVAEWLGHEKPWFYRHREHLEALGFPKALPLPGGRRWRGDALIAWSKHRIAVQDAITAPGSNVHSLAKLAADRSAALSGRRKAS